MSMSYEKPIGYRYGQWAGNPKGHVEDPGCCRFEVFPNDRSLHHQCNRKRGHGPNHAYCRQHARMVEAERGVSS